jgi:hypothetical protein
MNEEQQQPHPELRDLVQDLDLNTPLHELIEDPAIFEQPITFSPQELEQLDALAREYLQELSERGMIPDIPPMDIDPKLLEPERELPGKGMDIDFGR